MHKSIVAVAPALPALIVTLVLACGSSTPAPTVLASNEASPVALAVAPDNSAIYWLTNGSAAGSSAVRRLSLTDKSAQPSTVVTGFDKPVALAVTGTALYWLTGDGALHTAALSGTGATVLSTEPSGFTPFGLVVAGGNIYWMSSQDPGTDSSGNPTGAAVLAAMPVAGGARQQVVKDLAPWSADQRSNALLTGDGNNAYFVTADGNATAVAPDGTVTSIAKRKGQLSGIVVIGNIAYWLQAEANSTLLVQQAMGTIDPSKLVVVVPTTSAMVADSTGVYVAGPTTVAVSKVTVPSGDLNTLMSEPLGANAVALGPGAVYAVSADVAGGSRILKVSR
jgi:hypothetical protein